MDALLLGLADDLEGNLKSVRIHMNGAEIFVKRMESLEAKKEKHTLQFCEEGRNVAGTIDFPQIARKKIEIPKVDWSEWDKKHGKDYSNLLRVAFTEAGSWDEGAGADATTLAVITALLSLGNLIPPGMLPS